MIQTGALQGGSAGIQSSISDCLLIKVFYFFKLLYKKARALPLWLHVNLDVLVSPRREKKVSQCRAANLEIKISQVHGGSPDSFITSPLLLLLPLPLCQCVGEMGSVPVAQSPEIILYQLQIVLLVPPVLSHSCHRYHIRFQKTTLRQLLPEPEVKLFSSRVWSHNWCQSEFEFSIFYKCRWSGKRA